MGYRFTAAGMLLLAGVLLSGCATAGVINRVTFACDGGGLIDAVFYRDRQVRLTLPDGVVRTLPQTISADGARYADPSESFVFWTRGNGAFVDRRSGGRSGATRTWCILVQSDPGGLPAIFEDSRFGFSLRYPDGWRVDRIYRYSGLGPGRTIKGVSFSVPPSLTTGTNLAPDTRLSVELLPDAVGDSASRFLPAGATATSVTGDGTTYSVARLADAGAGNRYEETVYALPGTRPLLAVRYFIHYSVFENYPKGSVVRFDRQTLLATFDRIRRTLTVDEANVPER
ncbi:MliC family protein [Salinispira pacifica]